MVSVAEERDLQLPWDAFLEREARGIFTTTQGRERYLQQVRHKIEAFRRVEWPNIRRLLKTEHNWEVPEGLEPHWVEPGSAVLWQEQIRRVRMVDQDGVPRIEEVREGWAPTSPQTVNSASILAAFLKRNLRLRPPATGVAADVEVAVPSEADGAELLDRVFTCSRHADGPRSFTSWKAYLRHCDGFKELPDEAPPETVMRKAARFQYFCFLHGVGFKTQRLALRHIRWEMRRSGKAVHPTIEQMQVQKTGGEL